MRPWCAARDSPPVLGATCCLALAFLRRRRRFPLLLLETGSAKHRPALCRLERNRGLHAAFRTDGTRLRANTPPACALRLALFAVLRIVLELFVVKEKLLAGGEDELNAAIATLQSPVSKFHGRLPQHRENRPKSAKVTNSMPVPFPCDRASFYKGPGRIKSCGLLESSDRQAGRASRSTPCA